MMFRRFRLSRVAAPILFLFLPCVGVAFQVNPPRNVDLLARAVLESDRPLTDPIRVQLLNTFENYVADLVSTDGTGEVTFRNVRPGSYRLRVSGNDLEETVTPVFNIYTGETTHIEIVRVKRKKTAENGQSALPVSVASLKVPGKARAEFEKGRRALEQGDLAAATTHFQAALSIYPQFADALNSLGVISMRQGDTAAARGLFERALAADPESANSYVNLAKLSINNKDFMGGEDLLNKALARDPLDVEVLSLLAIDQFSQNHWDDAVATARKVHSLPHAKYAMVHYLAGAALDKQNKRDEAIEQFQAFLDEAPNSPSADKARNALRILRQTK